MKRLTLLIIFLWSAADLLQAQGHWSFKGTVSKMRMTDCLMQRGFMSVMAGTSGQTSAACPEYTVVSDKVVYVVMGRRTEEFIPLSENMEFLVRKNELVLFSEDEKARSHFAIQRMTLRADWDRDEARKELPSRIMEMSASDETHNPPRTSIASGNSQ